MEGDQKVERLKDGQFTDMTVDAAIEELKAADGNEHTIQEWLSGRLGPITIPDGSKYTQYTLLTLRWM
jgi:hypothetical protein